MIMASVLSEFKTRELLASQSLIWDKLLTRADSLSSW